MIEFHEDGRALATLAVQHRKTSRYLLFDGDGELCGRRAGENAEPELMRTAKPVHAFAFCGVHVISRRLLPLLTEPGAFSIIPAYLRLVASGEKIQSFRADAYYWRDLGRPADLAQAEEDLQQRRILL